MKKLLLGIAAACLAGFTFAQDAPLWMRHSVISPDGTTIAFTYKGDIYTVPVAHHRRRYRALPSRRSHCRVRRTGAAPRP